MSLATPKILYEDNHLLIVCKPVGYLSQADGSAAPDLLTWLKADLKQRYNKPGEVYLGLVHRLDRPVGGVLVFAKTSKAASRLSEQVRTHRLSKEYLLVCRDNNLADSGKMEDYLLKDSKTNLSRVVSPKTPGAKDARLSYTVLERQNGLALVYVSLETGRSHQIRVQFSSRGCPLWADARYGTPVSGGSIALYAWRLSLEHPTKKEPLTQTAPAPVGAPWSDFDLDNLEPRLREKGCL